MKFLRSMILLGSCGEGEIREVLCVVLFPAIVVGTTSGSVGVGVLLMLWGYQDHTQWC